MWRPGCQLPPLLRAETYACMAPCRTALGPRPECPPPPWPLLPAPQLFEYLLQKGADASILSFPPPKTTGLPGYMSDPRALAPVLLAPSLQGPKGPIDVAANKGFGWEVGAVRAKLAELIEQYRDVPKPPAVVYRGPGIGAPPAFGVGCALKLWIARVRLSTWDEWRRLVRWGSMPSGPAL